MTWLFIGEVGNGTWHYRETRYQILVLVNIEIPLTLQTNHAQDLEHQDR
ncbi:hypothetical protein [Nostoc sp. 'Peltigera membranacea cyanobiont' N6]|nr:hypothetical protein [Nostoc sp. 'Peltigera membranacea cyanobiont' N6]